MINMRAVLVSALGALLILPAALAAPIKPGEATGRGASDVLPRFAVLADDEVNMRTGPGRRYPIEWVYQRRGLPVEVIDEYAKWRRIRDPEGEEGWVAEHLLSNERAGLVKGDRIVTLFAQPKPNAKAVWRAEPGVMGTLSECVDAWCRIEIGEREGWVLRSHLWGVYGHENFR